MIALATVLSLIPLFQMPQGGTVTPASMVPIILISLKYDVKWALITSLAYAGIQMLVPPGIFAPPTPDFISYFLVILLDYVIAFGILGLAGTFGRLFKKPAVQIVAGAVIVIALRFLCHFTSGIVIWSYYAPQGQSAWLYSLLYNGPYMLIELVVSAIVTAILARFFIQNMKNAQLK